MLLVLLFAKTNLYAKHIVGGELTYVYNGNNTYTFTLNLYKDCNQGVQFQGQINLYIYQSTNFQTTTLGTLVKTVTAPEISGGTNGTAVAQNAYSPCFTPSSTLCVSEAVYQVQVTNLLPIAGGYTIIAQNAARNLAVANFNTASGNVGSTFMCIMPGTANWGDNSPVFSQLPPIEICQGQPFIFPYSRTNKRLKAATDPDGDSLSYSFYVPYDGSNTPPVAFNHLSWLSSYSPTNILGGTPNLTINDTSGVITCDPPTAAVFLVGIRVDEYRNGAYLGSIFRDIQFNVGACLTNVVSNVPTSTITTPSGTYDSVKLSCKYATPTVQFVNTSTPQNALSTYYWNFGDPTTNADTSNLAAPIYTYADTGAYRAYLVMNPGQLGTCTDTIWFNVRVYYNNIYGFKVATSGTKYTCELIQFTDTTKGGPNPMSYYWTFGDGDTSHHQSPSHVYIKGGTYTVTEIVQNSGGCKDTTTKSLTIISKFPTAAILNPLLDCSSDTIHFQTPTTSANYYWSFGDPTTTTDTSWLVNPTYVYPDSGVYTVSLIINVGYPKTCVDTALATFQVYPPFKAKFGYSPQMWCINMPIQFNDSSKGILMPNSWNWSFGDGDTSHHQSPSHVFTTAGTYNIKLISQNAKGCTDSMTVTKTIYPVAVANIIAPPLNCYSNNINFQTTGIAQNYFWNFGDTAVNDTSWHFQPAYNYLDTGVHQVILILNLGATGTCIDTATAQIKAYAPFSVGYTYLPPYICRKNMVHFVDTSKSIAQPLTWFWNLDDNNTTSTSQNPFHSYLDSGRYHIKLVIKNRVGCTDSVTKLIGVFAPPTARISAPTLVCSGLTVGFQSLTYSGGYFWKFNDATNSPHDTSWRFSPTFTFSDTGVYTTMFVVNPGAQDSCSDTAYATIKVFGPFVPKFGYFHAYNCPNHLIQFTDSSTGAKLPNAWNWNFGDTTFSASQSPTHVYKRAGTYTVKLIIQNIKGCIDSVTHTIVIDTQTHSGIVVPTVNCDSIVHFSSIANIHSYWWNFGEPSSGTKNNDTIKSPTHIYKTAGNYTITSIVYPNTGCADTAFATIHVEFGTHADFIPINSCVYDSALFFNTSTGGPSALIPSKWYFADGDSLISSASSVKHKYLTANTYTVKLVVQNTWGCMDSTKQSITIYPIPITHAGDDTSICNLDTISLRAFGGGTYAWYPNFSIDDTTSEYPLVTPDVTTRYYVYVVSPNGCFAKDSILITNINPKSDGLIFDTTICFGDTIQLKKATNGIKFLWTPSYALSSDTASKPFANPAVYTLYQVRIATGNCVRFDTMKVNVKVLATPNAGDDFTLCKGISGNLHATNGTFYSWKPTNNMLYSNSANPVISPTATTTYFVTVIDTFVCLKPETDSVIVHIDFYKNGDSQKDTNIVKNVPSTLYAWGGYSYLWMPSTGLSDSASATPTVTLQHDQVYVVKISDINGCYNFDTVHVYVFPNPIALMPNAFSPNGDGLDDEIMPIYAGIRTLYHFNIYNRWGQLLFSTTELNKGWDGTFHGEPQSMETYMYLIDGIDVEGNGFNYKGDITLVR